MSEQSKETIENSDIYARPTNDGLMNVISGLGTSKARNPSSRLDFDHRLDRTELESFYRCYWVAKAVDIKPWDMTRQWREFRCDDLDTKKLDALKDLEQEIEVAARFRTAIQWASLYGGGALIMHVDGHGDMSAPLDPSKIKQGQLKRLSAVDRWELIESQSIEYNPLSPNYKRAEYYHIAHDLSNQQIHRSRIIFFNGREMPIRVTWTLKGWGESDVQRWYSAITNNETLASAIIEGVHQSNVDVIGVKGLAQQLAMKDGEAKVRQRFMVMDACKSLLNMSITDSEDTFTRNAFPFSGLPDIWRIALEVLASATDIPVTRLLGSSPGGLNATGESDTRNYYDMIKSEQENRMSPKLRQLDEVLVRSAIGDYPDGLSFEYNSLWQMTPEEQATLNQTRASTLQILQSLGVDDYTLLRDAVEHGITSNLTAEDIDKMEAADSFEDDEDDFGEDAIDLDLEISKLIGDDDASKKKNEPKGAIKTTKSGRRYQETAAGNRAYLDTMDEIGFKEEKHKRDEGGKFSSTGGGGSGLSLRERAAKRKAAGGSTIRKAATTPSDFVKSAITASMSDEQIKEAAKESGVWKDTLPEIKEANKIGAGAESEVYGYGNNNVVKVKNASQYESLSEMLLATEIHNRLFPETKYTNLGVTEGAGGEISAIIKQRKFDGLENASKDEIRSDMESRGFKFARGNKYVSDKLVIDDISPDNVLIDDDGGLLYIDTRIKTK